MRENSKMPQNFEYLWGGTHTANELVDTLCFPAFFCFFSGASRQILPKPTLSSPKSPGLELSGGVEFPRGVGFPGGSSFPENDCDLKMA